MIASLALSLAGAIAQGHGEEWRVRRWALDPEHCKAELRAALSDDSWRMRASALDALVRAGSTLPAFAATAGELALDAVEDPHPSVRALALAVIAEVGSEGSFVPDEIASRLATDDLPEVRSALARSAGRGRANPKFLATLAFDADERVRRDARVGAFAGVGAASPAEVLARIAREEGSQELVHVLESCRRRLHLEGDQTPSFADGLDGDLGPGMRTLLAALRPDEDSAADLFSGWYTPLLVDRHVKGFLLEVGGLADPGVGSAALELFAEVDSGGSERFTAQVERARRLEGRERSDQDAMLLAIARESLGAECVLAMLAERPLSERAVVHVLEEVGFVADHWEPEVGRRFLAGHGFESRAVALAVLSGAWAGVGDPGAGELLAEVLRLGDPGEGAQAFLALCQSDDPRPHVADLLAYWRRLDDTDRIEALHEFSRRRPFEPFRADLLDLGERGGAARSSVIDLLELFDGDGGIVSAFARWLDGELSLVRDAADGTDRRAAELRAAGLLRALARVAGDDADRSVRSALAASVGLSEQVGKVAAALLGARAAKGDFLAGFLDPPVEQRTRIEVAIALAPTGDERALDVLLQEVASSTWDLGARMVDAVGGSPSKRALTWLAERSVDPRVSMNFRRKAIAAAAGRPPDDCVSEVLARAAADAPDVDSQLDAIRGLAALECDADVVSACLGGLWSALERGGDGTRISELSGDEREVVRAELLLALARVDRLPERLLGLVLADPIDAAGEWLIRRTTGEPTARSEVQWRVEIETAGVLFDHGRGLELLEASGPWWCMDGRLLHRMAERAARSPGASAQSLARVLQRAAGIASFAEGEADDENRLQLLLLGAELACREEDWQAYAAHAATLARAWREQGVSDRSWHRFVGRIQRRLGEDPPSLLTVSGLQSHARVALTAGDRERARRFARAAAERTGYSARAATMGAEFEALLRE